MSTRVAALTILPNISLESTIIDWFRKTYPAHVHQQVDLEVSTDPYHVLIDFYIDIEFNAICITNVSNLRNPPMGPVRPYRPIVTKAIGNCRMDHIIQRIQWLQGNIVPTSPLFPEDDELEFSTRMIVGIIMEDERKIERDIWLKHWADTADDYDYGILPLIIPTMEDRIHCQHEWIPTHWYEVPFEDVPLGGSFLHPGGRVHITYKELGEYVWYTYYEKELRALKIRAMEIPMHPQLQYASTYIKQQKKRAEPTHFVDVEDIGSILPGCLSCNRSFPGDLQRQYLVRSLRGAGITLKSTEEYLTVLNDRYPHSSGRISLKRRWDYEQHYEKGYAPPNCEQLTEFCPFKGPLDKRKMQCHALFKEKFPEKYRDSDAPYFYGPKNWLKWILYNSKT